MTLYPIKCSELSRNKDQELMLNSSLGLILEVLDFSRILAAEKYLVCLVAFVSRCTSLYGTPTMFIDVLNHPALDKFDVSSLHTG